MSYLKLPLSFHSFGTASSVSRLTSDTEGVASAFARADHTHRVLEESATIIATGGSTTLDINSNNRIVFTGSTIGTVLNLGNSTTYNVGKIIKLYNNSTQTVSIVNNSIVEIYRFEPFCSLEIILQDNSSLNGIWYFVITYPSYDKFVLVTDDFIASTTAGESNYTATVNGAGSAVTQVTTLFGRLGVNSLTTGSTNTGRSCLNKGGNIILFNNGVTVFETSVRIDTLSVLADRYIFQVGYGDNVVSGDMLDGVYFEYNEGTSGNFWLLKTSNNSIRTIVTTTSPIVINTWYKLKIEISALGTRADFFVNDVNVGNITTNIPTGTNRNTGILLKIEKTAGGNPRLVYVDYTNFKAFLVR